MLRVCILSQSRLSIASNNNIRETKECLIWTCVYSAALRKPRGSYQSLSRIVPGAYTAAHTHTHYTRDSIRNDCDS